MSSPTHPAQSPRLHPPSGSPPMQSPALPLVVKKRVTPAQSPRLHSSSGSPSKQSPALPLVVKKRKTSALSQLSISDEFHALQLFDQLMESCKTPEATLLTLIQRYNINLDVLKSIGVNRLHHSFSKVKYSAIAKVFDLDPTDESLSQFERFEMQRSRLPLAIVKEICHDVEIADAQYGRMITHNNEEARSRYIATIFSRIIYLFRRKLTNRPEELLDAEFTDRGRIEHQFLAFGAVVVLFIEVKRNLLTGQARLDQVAQVLAEADACDYRNSCFSLWVPVLGVLCDGRDFHFFVYDSSTRKFSLSAQVEGLYQYSTRDLDFLKSIKRTAEYMYDFFLSGYINGLRAFLEKSNQTSAREGSRRVSTEQWNSALHCAELALHHARGATKAGAAGHVRRAEEQAKQAVALLGRSVEEAPDRPMLVTNMMDAWDEDALLKD